MRYLLVIFVALGCSGAWGAFSAVTQASEGIEWFTPDRYQSLKPLGFRLTEFPENDFLLIFPEWITGREASWHVRPQWRLTGSTAVATWQEDEVAFRMEVQHRLTETGPELRWAIRFSNDSRRKLTDVAAFNCFNLVDAPAFKDLGMNRTWVAEAKGQRVRLADVKKTKGPRTMQFYPARGGLPLAEFERYSRYAVTSKETLAGDRIGVDSVDGKWTLECVIDQPAAFFFNNWEDDHGCIHAAPQLGDVAPGESAAASGHIRFTRRTDDPSE
ncbi:hypothetical protein [Lignipirellula cremea]|uniref:Uncharacterized protein n=1 Tax=Lignipirellula cremea TaxID=2528010 RepID=A0A518DVV3_9BACT|nr:hypothetical protein [Lignipirellula cremea]QDU95966.1 hypothetical protein Pla8534_37850 [Lignipirellula cremea]